MSKQYDNTNSGAIFRNDKDGNEKRPDWKGTINVDGKEYQLSAWERESKQGQPYLSCKVEPAKPKGERRQQPNTSDHGRAKSNGYQPQNDDTDDIPF